MTPFASVPQQPGHGGGLGQMLGEIGFVYKGVAGAAAFEFGASGWRTDRGALSVWPDRRAEGQRPAH